MPNHQTVEIDGVDRPIHNSIGALIAPNLRSLTNFWRWYKDSQLLDSLGRPIVVFHGTNGSFDEFEFNKEGIHFGSPQQASMRASGQGKNIVAAYILLTNAQTSKDLGGKWASKVKSAKSAKRDGIIYLNRYEGIDYSSIEKAQARGFDFDRATDKEVRAFAPELSNSYIVFDPKCIKSAIGNSGMFCPHSASLTDNEDQPSEDDSDTHRPDRPRQ